MKKTFTVFAGMLCAFFFGFAMTAQQTHTMQINLRSGETVEYTTDEVLNVTFDQGTVSNEFSVSFTVDELTQSSVSVTITPSNNTQYFAMILTKGWIINPDGSYLSDKDIIESYVADPNYENRCYTGTQTLSGESYKPGTQLTVIAFDAAARYDTSNYEVFKQDVTIQSGDVEDQFVISNLVATSTGVSFHAKANDHTKPFIAVALQKSYFDKYVENGEEMQRFYYILDNAAGTANMSSYVSPNCKYDEADFSFTEAASVEMKPNTKYIVAVFYVNPTNDDVYTIYDWNYTYQAFTTLEAQTLPTIEVTNVSMSPNTTSYAGYYDYFATIKTTNAKSIYICPATAAKVEPYLDSLAESDPLFFGGRSLYSSQIEQANNTGYDWTVEGFDNGESEYIIALVVDENGGRAATAVKIQ